MKTNSTGLAGVCLISLAILAAMLIPGLSMLPSIATAQTITGKVCSPSMVTGCFDCNGTSSPGGTGCDGMTTPPAGFQVGICVDGSRFQSCTSGIMDCGNEKDCTTNPPTLTGDACADLDICS